MILLQSDARSIQRDAREYLRSNSHLFPLLHLDEMNEAALFASFEEADCPENPWEDGRHNYSYAGRPHCDNYGCDEVIVHQCGWAEEDHAIEMTEGVS